MQRQKVFILRKIKIKESDLILHVLTNKGTKVSLIARGAAKSRKRFSGGVLEPMHYVEVVYKTSGKNSVEDPIYHLSEAKLIKDFFQIKSSIEKIETGLYMVSAVAKMAKESTLDSENLFHLLGNGLSSLEESEKLRILKVQFVMKLLNYQGVLIPELRDEKFLELPLKMHQKIQKTNQDVIVLERQMERALEEYIDA